MMISSGSFLPFFFFLPGELVFGSSLTFSIDSFASSLAGSSSLISSLVGSALASFFTSSAGGFYISELSTGLSASSCFYS